MFTQFSSDLDDETKKQLAYGNGLMELLKQPLGHPMSLAEQVITLVVATGSVLSDHPPAPCLSGSFLQSPDADHENTPKAFPVSP